MKFVYLNNVQKIFCVVVWILFFVILLTLAFWTTIPPLSFNTICICINFSIAPILIVILRRTSSISNSFVNEREDTSFIIFFSTVSFASYKSKETTFASLSYSLIIRFITFIEWKLFYLLASFQSIDLFLLEQDSTLLDPLSSHSTGQNNESLLEENNCRMLQWLKIRSIFLFIFLFISSWINHPTTNNYHRRISMGIRNH